MIRLVEIRVYPVKSLAGVRVEEAEVDDRGLAADRRFMVVDPRGRFVTQREHPSLALVRATIDGGALVLRSGDDEVRVARDAEGPTVDVTVWQDTVAAVDAGDEAAALLGRHVGAEVRLVRMPEATRRRADPEHAREGDLVSFADGFPFLLASTASLAALNERLDAPVDMRRFRPNLVIEGVGPFEEDALGTFTVGEVTFHAKKDCGRCAVVDVDPDRGERRGDVLAELGRFRREGKNVRFGQNLVHDGRGTLRVGMPVAPAPVMMPRP